MALALMWVWAVCGFAAAVAVLGVLTCGFLGRQSSRDSRMRAGAARDAAAGEATREGGAATTAQYGRRRTLIRRRPQ